MRARSRAVSVAAAILLVLLALPLALQTPWVKGRILQWAAGWIRDNYGLVVRADTVDFKLAALAFQLDNVQVADPAAPDRPFARAMRLEVDLAAPVWRGRPVFDRIAIRQPSIQLDPSTRPSASTSPPPPAPANRRDTAEHPIEIRALEIENLDVGMGAPGSIRIVAREISAAMAGGSPGPLEGDIAAAGGVSIGTDGARMIFNRADAHLLLDLARFGLEGSLTARSPVSDLRLDGSTSVAGDGQLDLTYAATGNLAEIAQWWSDAPRLEGRTALKGTVRGPLTAPEVSFDIDGTGLSWAPVRDATVAISGRWTPDAVTLERLSLTSSGAMLEASGLLSLDAAAASRLQGRWGGLGAGLISELFALPQGTVPRAALSGTMALTWTGPRPVPGGIEGRVEATAIGAAAGDQSASGTLVASGRGGRWRVGYRQSLDGPTHATLDGVVVLDETRPEASRASAVVDVQSNDLMAAVAQLRRLGISIPDGVAAVRVSAAAFRGNLTGTVTTPRVTGTLTMESARVGEVRNVRMQGEVALDDRVVEVSSLVIESPGNRVVIDGTLPWQGETGEGTVQAQLERVQELAAALPPRWRPMGTLEVSGRWAGSAETPAATVSLVGTGVSLAGTTLDTVTADVAYASRTVTLRNVRLTQQSGALTADGAWDLEAGTLAATLSGNGLSLVAAAEDGGEGPALARARDVTIEAHLEGPVARPSGRGSLAAGSVELNGHLLGPVTARITASDGGVDVALDALDHGARLEGRVAMGSAWPFRAQVTLARLDLVALGPLAGLDRDQLSDVSAAVDATGDVSGTLDDLAALDATVTVNGLDGRIRGLPLTLSRAGRIQVDGGAVHVVDDLRLGVGSAAVTLSSAPGAPTEHGIIVAVDGPIGEIASALPDLVPEDLSFDGTVSAKLGFSHRPNLEDFRGTVTAELSSVHRGTLELARDVRLDASTDGALVELRTLTGTLAGSTVEAHGRAPLAWLTAPPSEAGGPGAAFSVTSTVDLGRTIGSLSGEDSDVTGTLTLSVDGTAAAPRLDAVRATLDASAGTVVLAGIAFSERRPTSIRLEEGRLRVDTFEWQAANSDIEASGTVGLAEGVDGRLDLKGRSSLALLNYLVPGRVDGEARFDLEVSGAPGERQVRGTLELEDGSLLLEEARVALADWSGTIEVREQGVAIKDLRGQINGGDAAISGRFPMDGAQDTASTVTVTVTDAFMDVPRGLRSQINASLELSLAPERPRLTGRLTITADAYREPITALAAIGDSLMARGGRPPIAFPSPLAATTLDIQVVTVGPLAMRNSFAQVAMQPDLRITGTIGQPALSGQIVVADDGRILLSGRSYQLRDSRVSFSPDLGLVPNLDVRGDTRVGDYTVFLRIRGALNEFETALSSDPPLGERDLQTLLVTGQVGSRSNSRQTDRSAVGAVSSDVLGIAGQFLGLDAVQVGTSEDLMLVSSDVKPALRLTVSKRLGSYFELVLSDNLDDSELTWVVIYRPRRGYQFRFLSRQNEDTTIEFRQEIEFGSGVPPPRRLASARVQRERVAAVTVTGEPGFDEADVLGRVTLKPGSRFDFSGWLEDRERIAAFYQEHGYFAARIVPTRRAVDTSGEPAVDLNYRITRGPATALRVEGYAVPADVVDDLRNAWAHNVLVALLDTDLAGVLRDHLVDVGFLRSTVHAEVDHSSPERVSVVMRVEPGPKSADRRFAFSGNTVIGDDALQAIASVGNLGDGAWKEAAPLVSAIEHAYAERGYLAAKATAGVVEYGDATATMPISILEGEATRLTSVRLNGVERVPEPEAEAATGLTPGAVYVAGSDQAARQRLLRWYRERGYRDAAVEARAQVDPEGGRAEVTMEIAEGPQYVVSGVRTTGVESTKASLVERATQIEPGTPASPELATRTRRQLYDIGTFRSAEMTFEPVAGSPGGTTIPVEAVVTLQESRRFVLQYGVETTSQYEPVFGQRTSAGGVAADVRDRNFLGRGWSIGTGFRYEPRFKTTRALFTVPRLGDEPIRTNFYGNVRRQDREGSPLISLQDDEVSLSVEQRWRPTAPIELSWGYTFDDRDITFRARQTGESLLEFHGQLAELGAAVVVDRRDNLFDARRGWMFSASAGWGLRPLGSDLDYLRTLVRASYFRPMGPLTLASNVRWGNLKAIGGQPPLTVLDLFYTAGGTQTVRGYEQDSLSAYELFGAPLGGTRLLVFNQEVRVPLFWLLSGAAFVDAGNTFTDRAGIVLSDLALGLGFGIRIRTPLAPVRIDMGFPMDRRPGDRRYRFHFSIGQMF